MVFVSPYSDLRFGGPFSRGGFFGSKKYIFNDQIKKIKCPCSNVFRAHIYINTALSLSRNMFKKDDVGSHSLLKRDLHFGGQVPVGTLGKYGVLILKCFRTFVLLILGGVQLHFCTWPPDFCQMYMYKNVQKCAKYVFSCLEVPWID